MIYRTPPKHTEIDWSSKIKEALDRTEFLALSTNGAAGIWTSPVAYAYSEKAELFFISMMSARHSQNILTDPNVSAAIYKTERFEDGNVLGLQLSGTAEHLTDPGEIKEAARHYFDRSPANQEFKNKTADGSGASALWQFFRITPTELWCIDTRVFGEERKKVEVGGLTIKI